MSYETGQCNGSSDLFDKMHSALEAHSGWEVYGYAPKSAGGLQMHVRKVSDPSVYYHLGSCTTSERIYNDYQTGSVSQGIAIWPTTGYDPNASWWSFQPGDSPSGYVYQGFIVKEILGQSAEYHLFVSDDALTVFVMTSRGAQQLYCGATSKGHPFVAASFSKNHTYANPKFLGETDCMSIYLDGNWGVSGGTVKVSEPFVFETTYLFNNNKMQNGYRVCQNLLKATLNKMRGNNVLIPCYILAVSGGANKLSGELKDIYLMLDRLDTLNGDEFTLGSEKYTAHRIWGGHLNLVYCKQR